jgi:hypothetical protein
VSDTQFPEDSRVQVRYPLTVEQERGERGAWPWLPGRVAAECGPGKWQIRVQAPEVAVESDGETFYPSCFRESSELRPTPQPEPEPEPEPEPGMEAGT